MPFTANLSTPNDSSSCFSFSECRHVLFLISLIAKIMLKNNLREKSEKHKRNNSHLFKTLRTPPTGLEPVTLGLEVRCSIQLS